VKAPFALCPVHAEAGQAIPLYRVPPGRVAIAGRVVAVEAVFSRIGMDPEDAPSVIVRPGIAYRHPSQLIIVPVRISEGTIGEFMDLGDGAFALPEGTEIERSPAGDLCAYNPAIGRHSVIGPFPLGGLN
jgi:hypothetical protein